MPDGLVVQHDVLVEEFAWIPALVAPEIHFSGGPL
jgi:hypothetical protein